VSSGHFPLDASRVQTVSVNCGAAIGRIGWQDFEDTAAAQSSRIRFSLCASVMAEQRHQDL
jgi:hypothetical protein